MWFTVGILTAHLTLDRKCRPHCNSQNASNNYDHYHTITHRSLNALSINNYSNTYLRYICDNNRLSLFRRPLTFIGSKQEITE